jgi:hypothetical protein
VTASKTSLPGLLVVMSCVTGCAPALHEPRPLEANPAGESASELLEEARASFARRPDLDAVRAAAALFRKSAAADETGVDGLVGSVLVTAWLLDHDRDLRGRESLAREAVDSGQLCLRRQPDNAWCDYALGIGLGLQARERHATAAEGLKLMAEHLRRAEAREPGIDAAGPERVLALLLLRAPGWPLGPGDPEEGLAEARKAVSVAPDHPPNDLALAEALLANGMAEPGRAAARRAEELARREPVDPDAPDWVRDAEKLLAGKDAS